MAESHARAAMAEATAVLENRWLFRQRTKGATIEQIAQMATVPPVMDGFGGYSDAGGLGRPLTRSTISRRIREILREHADELRNDVELERTLELSRLEAQIARVSLRVLEASAAGALDVHGENLLLKLSAERRKLLGLDTPTVVKVEADVTIDDARSRELAAMLDALDVGPSR